MPLIPQHWRQDVDRLRRRFLTFCRAWHSGNDEERFRLIRFVALRLPIRSQTKQSVLRWAMNRLGSRRFSASGLASAQRQWVKRGHDRLESLLRKQERIRIPASSSPVLSLIMVLLNNAELSVLAIDSVVASADFPYELILIDNGSNDRTCSLLERIDGAKILRNTGNIGFGPACMQAAAIARGHFLCFLNNDVLLTGGALQRAVHTLTQPEVGAVGGKIILADGRLQEAGSIIWRDGSAYGYGRGDDPDLPQYTFRRPVDYCSAVFLLTRKELFDSTGGFSKEFVPAYYEDTDYCMNVWQRGYSVLYEPLASIVHFESATSGGVESAAALMLSHQKIFTRKWSVELQKHFRNDPANLIPARISVNARGSRVIYIDDRQPHRFLGAGFPRSNDILRELVALGNHVVCATFTFPISEDKYGDIPMEVEQFDGFRSREDLIERYFPWADVVWVSRPHNLKLLLAEHPGIMDNRRFAIVYDAEAIFSERRLAQLALIGEAKSEPLHLKDIDEEFALARAADAVVVVSERDRQRMLANGVRQASVVGFRLSVAPTPRSFDDRHSFLFIGSVHGSENPNSDSLRYFCNSIWREVRHATGAVLEIAGSGTELLQQTIAAEGVRIHGQVSDLEPLYDRARVFVVPTRYAAGLPFKAHEAAAYGVPLVVSELIAGQLRWSDGQDYLVGRGPREFTDHCVLLYRDEKLWTRLRESALARVSEESSATGFQRSIARVLEQVRPAAGGLKP
jgi:O-antigen biosynthesis protein